MDLFEIKLRKTIRSIIMESEFGYTLIGYIKGSNVKYALGDYYIFLKTNLLNSDNIKEIRKNLLVTEDREGKSSNYAHYIFEGLDKFAQLLPQYKNTPIEEAIHGMSQKRREALSKQLMDSIKQETVWQYLPIILPTK